MPHIIVEYSRVLDDHISEVLTHAHHALSKEGIDKARIKSRGIALDHAIVGDKGTEGKMAHVTLLLLTAPDRDVPTKKRYGDAIIDKVKTHLPEDVKVTMEIRDMNPDTYYL